MYVLHIMHAMHIVRTIHAMCAIYILRTMHTMRNIHAMRANHKQLCRNSAANEITPRASWICPCRGLRRTDFCI
jgi:hypothetical protein